MAAEAQEGTMANVTIAKNFSSDIRNINFNAFQDGVSYSQNATLFVIGYGTEWKHEFRGTGFSYNSSHEFTGGTITGFSENCGSTRAFSIDQIHVAATTIATASRTESTADDYVVIAAVLAGDDRFLGGDKTDYLNGFAGADALHGNAGNDTLLGGAGNDMISGGTGVDWMLGGAGNDIYQVDNAGDVVDESAAGSNGADTVQSSISFSLANTIRVKGAVEHLALLGTAALSGTGNNLANVLRGNSAGNTLSGAGGNDTLAGGAGADWMRGGAGNDVYQVDNAGDVVDESIVGSSGVDTVQSSISFNLANTIRVKGAVEHLTLLGTAALSGTGNNLANVLRGNSAGNALSGGAGNDTLYGGAGKDQLTGGAAYDTFVFNTALNPVTNVDFVKDFNVFYDRIAVDNAVMPGLGATLGTLSAAQFWKSTSGLAHDPSDRIIYETDTGKLFYDANGNAAGGRLHLSTLTPNLQLTNADFVVI
jgi:Ca2+-binding RTX toxin-like protein